jgi:AcrR family transcriptional regulator
MAVFWAKGYDGASLSGLTKAMGINSPSLYAAFGSKEALFNEAVELYATNGRVIWDGVTGAPTAREAIAHVLRASADAYTKRDQPRGCLIVLSALNANDANATVRRALRRRRAGNTTLLRQRLERAVREGELPKNLDCQAVARFYTTVQHGMSIQARDGASHKTLRGVADSAMAAWQGLTAAP